jgi:hypothetical protein
MSVVCCGSAVETLLIPAPCVWTVSAPFKSFNNTERKKHSEQRHIALVLFRCPRNSILYIMVCNIKAMLDSKFFSRVTHIF